MPQLDGIAARAAAPFGERVRIVALTADATDDCRRACAKAGMDEFITKPVTRERRAIAEAERAA